jgi:hypothetical protein
VCSPPQAILPIETPAEIPICIVVVVVVVVVIIIVFVIIEKERKSLHRFSIYCLGLLESCDLREHNKRGMHW